jgi:diguanylate cyclase (GGDEF)-like protein/PAS domain S-box-containing protein
MILDILDVNSFRNGLLIFVDEQGNYVPHHKRQKSGHKIFGINATDTDGYLGLETLSERMMSAKNVHFLSQGKDVFVSVISGDFIQQDSWFLVEVIPTSNLAGTNRPYLIIVLLISVFGILFSLILGYTMSKYWLLNPIKNLTSMAEKISQGEFPDLATDRQSDDEIGALCTTFNQMSKALAIVEQERMGHVIALNEEIADRKQNESDLVLHRTFFEQSSDAMFITDNQARITNVNKAFIEMTGYSLEEAIGQQPGMLNSERHDSEFYQGIWDSLDKTGTWQGEIWDRRKGKEMFPSLHTLNTIKNVNGEMHYVSVFKDISQLKEAENNLWRIAHFDSLTGLANRKLLEERINAAITSAQNTGRHGAVLFLDLDNFKHINDSLGHNCGDLLLKEISNRLVSVFRAEDTVARLGGDEYVILIKELPSVFENAMLQTKQIIEKLFSSLHRPCFIDNYKLHISTSMGVVLFPNGGDEELFPGGGVNSG